MYLAHLKRPTLPKATIATFSMLSSRPISHSHPSFVLDLFCESPPSIVDGAPLGRDSTSLIRIHHTLTHANNTHTSIGRVAPASGFRFLCVSLSPARVDAFDLFLSLHLSPPPRDSTGIRLRTISEWRTFLDETTTR